MHDYCYDVFVWVDSLRPINNLSVIKGQVFLGWTSTELGLMFLLKTQHSDVGEARTSGPRSDDVFIKLGIRYR